jgi:hypothetical protein
MARVSKAIDPPSSFSTNGSHDASDSPTNEILARLEQAVTTWIQRGTSRELHAWLSREIDGQGLLKRLPIVWSWRAWGRVMEARAARPTNWPEPWDERLSAWLASTLRFSRPDASPVFGPNEPPDVDAIRRAARLLPEVGAKTVFDRWFAPHARSRGGRAAPPLPAISFSDRPLAVLRADWESNGDLVAVDHRRLDSSSLFELMGGGRRWLGPDWGSADDGPATAPARTSHWSTRSYADFLEWRFRAGETQITRSAVYLRGRAMALLAELRSGPNPMGSMHVSLAPGVSAGEDAESRALWLKSDRRGAACQAIPLALPALRYATDRGSFTASGGMLDLRQRVDKQRVWMPLLLSWDPARNKKAVHWRVLTVVEQSKICAPSVAFAARVGWGRGDGLVFYRSFARPALRSFLGYQSTARFFVGSFSSEGEVTPLLTIE